MTILHYGYVPVPDGLLPLFPFVPTASALVRSDILSPTLSILPLRNTKEIIVIPFHSTSQMGPLLSYQWFHNICLYPWLQHQAANIASLSAGILDRKIYLLLGEVGTRGWREGNWREKSNYTSQLLPELAAKGSKQREIGALGFLLKESVSFLHCS